MMDGDLPHSDGWTTPLLTNREFLDVDQKGRDAKVVLMSSREAVWTSKSASADGYYLAIFNRGDSPLVTHFTWGQLGLVDGTHLNHDIWSNRDLAKATGISVTPPPHGCLLNRAVRR
jgi:hypothetical protein